MQVSEGRYFLHEHPLMASSWKEQPIKSVTNLDGTFVTTAHMRAYGMRIPDKAGNQFVYKPTQFTTNSPLIAAQLERRCDKSHKHARLEGSRTRKAAIYPTQLVDAICKGMEDQIKADKVASIDELYGQQLLAAFQEYQANAAKCHEPDYEFEYAEEGFSRMGSNASFSLILRKERENISCLHHQSL